MQESRTDGSFSYLEVFNQEKMMKRLLDPEVESINVFQATPSNMNFAKHRALYPNLTRKQIKARIKHDKKKEI